MGVWLLCSTLFEEHEGLICEKGQGHALPTGCPSYLAPLPARPWRIPVNKPQPPTPTPTLRPPAPPLPPPSHPPRPAERPRMSPTSTALLSMRDLPGLLSTSAAAPSTLSAWRTSSPLYHDKKKCPYSERQLPPWGGGGRGGCRGWARGGKGMKRGGRGDWREQGDAGTGGAGVKGIRDARVQTRAEGGRCRVKRAVRCKGAGLRLYLEHDVQDWGGRGGSVLRAQGGAVQGAQAEAGAQHNQSIWAVNLHKIQGAAKLGKRPTTRKCAGGAHTNRRCCMCDIHAIGHSRPQRSLSLWFGCCSCPRHVAPHGPTRGGPQRGQHGGGQPGRLREARGGNGWAGGWG